MRASVLYCAIKWEALSSLATSATDVGDVCDASVLDCAALEEISRRYIAEKKEKHSRGKQHKSSLEKNEVRL